MRRVLILGALALGACSTDPGKTAGPLSADVTISSDPLVSGAVLGPDGSSICSSLSNPFGDLFLVRPIDPGGEILPTIFIFCPENTFAVNLPAGNYYLRATLLDDPILGNLPTRTVVPITVGTADVVQNIVVQPGEPLGGSARIDSTPLPDVDMTLTYAFDSRFAAAIGASGENGTWTEFFRPPMILQPGVRYQRQTQGCPSLGARTLEAPPLQFLFPTEVNTINCTLETAVATKFSHTHTRLVTTPLPGEFGGQSYGLVDKYGVGWGVQFPVEPGASPERAAFRSHLFGGGLMIGIAPDRILTGIDITGQLDCTTCQDLGLDGVVHFTPETGIGRMVTWRYSDATSPEGVGLQIVQRSYDGQRPNDYVLFKFSIKNVSPNTLTFYAGAFMDWDVDDGVGDDYGFTQMDNRLMAQASLFDETGFIVGTLLMGAPIAGTSFWNGFDFPRPVSTTAQFQALSGGLQHPEVNLGDVHYIQGAGPITLKRNKKVTLWIALVAGENHDALIANATAAQADVARRQDEDDDAASDGPLTVTTTSTRVAQPRPQKTKVMQ